MTQGVVKKQCAHLKTGLSSYYQALGRENQGHMPLASFSASVWCARLSFSPVLLSHLRPRAINILHNRPRACQAVCRSPADSSTEPIPGQTFPPGGNAAWCVLGCGSCLPRSVSYFLFPRWHMGPALCPATLGVLERYSHRLGVLQDHLWEGHRAALSFGSVKKQLLWGQV